MNELDWDAEYRDGRAGFEGKLLARHEYPNGCIRITLVATEGRGKEAVEHSLDIQDLEIKVPWPRPDSVPGDPAGSSGWRNWLEREAARVTDEPADERAPVRTGGPGTTGRARPTGRQ